MADNLISVGIDLGTTTTQVIFSRITVENLAGAASVPKVAIINKKIVHKGAIRFTPLLAPNIIDAEKALALVEEEYEKAGFKPSDISAGAAIITGETARKENSQAVLRTLSGLAGEFVVATAGSDLESILAGRGAGTAEISKLDPQKPLANLDVGGGTTNIAVFLDGRPVDTSCLDIGGRQITVDTRKKTIFHISEKYLRLARDLSLDLEVGSVADLKALEKLCLRLSQIMAQALGLIEANDKDLDLFITAHRLKKTWPLAALTFSGGVADYVYEANVEDPFLYGDIGPLLGRSIATCPALGLIPFIKPYETIRATVVGAGANSLALSGSTITVSHPEVLPLKNLPILKLTAQDEDDNYKWLPSKLSEKLNWFQDSEEGGYQIVAIALTGPLNPSYDQVLNLRDRLIEALDDYLRFNDILIIAVENDLAKSLGQALRSKLADKKIISLDSIEVDDGDYLDIGLPVAGGRVVPLVVKTLIFGR
ncbi:MAG: ethanolamine ammonia-lyase reactivating factor EutA [Deltaproteobacteria bacterium]|nr:ethanolamine ammonia-lyase reactivating factor EutA [Deltaproteobacteria bacterium]